MNNMSLLAKNCLQTIYSHLKRLCFDVGSRPKGSKENKLIAEYVESVLVANDIPAIRQEFPSLNWQLEEAKLVLANKELSVVANGFCPSCDLSAEFVTACTFDELAGIDFKNKILVLYGELVKDELEAKPVSGEILFFPQHSKKIYDFFDATLPLALIIVNHNERRIALHNDPNFRVPSVTVPLSSGREILLSNSKSKISLAIKGKRNKTTSWNVIGKIAGKQKNGKIILCSHFDSKFYSPGAYDNGSGMAVFLTLAEMLKNAESNYSIEFLALNGEEFIGIGRGSDKYVAEYGVKMLPYEFGMEINPCDEFRDVVVAFNFDRIGLISGTDSVGVIQGSNALKKIVLDCKKNYPGIIYKNALPIGNHYLFSSQGVPCIHCSSFENIGISHSCDDTLDWISEKKLMQMTQLSYDIIANLMSQKLTDLRKNAG